MNAGKSPSPVGKGRSPRFATRRLVTIIVSEFAERDLFDGHRFYDLQDAGLGDYFLDSLFSDIDSLRLFAGIHRKVFG